MATENHTETLVNEAEVERTFTQSEMDAIISDRLKRERSKYVDYDDLKAKAAKYDEFEESNKSELQKATERANELQSALDKLKSENEIRTIREKVSSEMGVPMALLNADSEEACKAQAEAILAFAKPSSSYPKLKDAGEHGNVGGGTSRELFADWLNDALKH